MHVKVIERKPIRLSIGERKQTAIELKNTVIVNGIGADPYRGSYVVTPMNYEQVLPTKNKGMKDDMTVKEVPYFEVSNQFGTTLVIGE